MTLDHEDGLCGFCCSPLGGKHSAKGSASGDPELSSGHALQSGSQWSDLDAFFGFLYVEDAAPSSSEKPAIGDHALRPSAADTLCMDTNAETLFTDMVASDSSSNITHLTGIAAPSPALFASDAQLLCSSNMSGRSLEDFVPGSPIQKSTANADKISRNVACQGPSRLPGQLDNEVTIALLKCEGLIAWSHKQALQNGISVWQQEMISLQRDISIVSRFQAC